MRLRKSIVGLLTASLILTGCGSSKTPSDIEEQTPNNASEISEESTDSSTSGTQEQSINESSETAEESVEPSVIDTIPLDIQVGDFFIIKEAKYSQNHFTDGIAVKLKIQNVSDLDFNDMSIQTYSYNKDNERITGHYISMDGLEPDLTLWTGYITTKCPLDEFGAISINSVRLGNLVGNVSEEVLKQQLTDPIKITVDQMTEE